MCNAYVRNATVVRSEQGVLVTSFSPLPVAHLQIHSLDSVGALLALNEFIYYFALSVAFSSVLFPFKKQWGCYFVYNYVLFRLSCPFRTE